MEQLAEDIAAAISTDEVVEITRDLVRAESENPPGNEAVAVAAARKWLEEVGCHSLREVEEIQGRPSLLGEWGEGERPLLIFNGHIDVVPAGDPRDWRHHPYGAEVEGDRIYGRGTSDMKGGIASMIEAIAALNRMQFTARGRVLFQLVADEESFGIHGTNFLLREGLLRGDAAVISEPTSLMVCLGERGAWWATVSVKGRAAHGSMPHLGVSAVEKAARATIALHKRDFDTTDPLLGSPSLNVGVIDGGSKINIVADRASFAIDRRVLPGESRESVFDEISTVLDQVRADDPEGDEYEFDIDVFEFAEASVVDRDAPIVRAVGESIREVTGGEPEFFGMSGTTDARFLRNNAGIPTVVFGPGIMAAAHTIDEYIEIPPLVTAAEIYAHLVARYLS